MEAVIEDVRAEGADWQVGYRTPFGPGRGRWRGNAPVVGERYLVELSVGETMTWGLDLEVAEDAGGTPRLEVFSAGMVVIGLLESWEPDGCAVLRLGPNILVLQTDGDAPPVGTWVRATVSAVDLYDIHA